MKRKWLMGVITGLVLFGGVVGLGALANNDQPKSAQTLQTDIATKVNYVDDYLDDDRLFDDQRDNGLTTGQIPSVNITKEEAIAIATQETSGEVIKIELDDARYYEIDVMTDQYKVEYKIDANTGEILAKEFDDDRFDD